MDSQWHYMPVFKGVLAIRHFLLHDIRPRRCCRPQDHKVASRLDILLANTVYDRACQYPAVVCSRRLYQPNNACQPDSAFRVGYGSYDIWTISGFFQITLAYGQLSFTAAKIITVCWDIIIGRCGQAVLVIVSYQVYTRALVRSMESSPVSYGTFEAVTLQNGSLTSLLKLSRDLLKHRTARARLTVVWLVISGSFVLSFQTLVSAMAGYTANIEPFVQVPSGNMVPYSDFQLVRYIVHDAHRLNDSLGPDFPVAAGNTNPSDNSL
ncbi:hypothetical protein EDD36DRAFT_162615 [Exophiala viscosa]|uniref:Uncharacterized protein n=1 Tax=Exophiala viscosa TaxID=2486360 RepID=A0AAN6DYR5_9EURO|nr:hypothetical protein EDD36DRAFT_162615 [Exophiala viscosa]